MSKEKGNGKGPLIALEGTHGPDLSDEAQSLLKRITGYTKHVGVSRWDASNTFFEMRFVKVPVAPPSPRTLLLLYASDLSFRLRWEVQPALDEGKIVIAAPYVESAVAFGVSSGLSRQWLADLFGFAPKPAATYRIKEKRKRWHKKLKPEYGFLEFCCHLLSATSRSWDPEKMRGKALDYLDSLEKHGVNELKKKTAAEIAKGKWK